MLAMRSSVGVGMVPPNVLGAPKPTSSVMMSSTLGAPCGGTTAGGHHGFEALTFGLITPPNFGGGGGRRRVLSVSVALGAPAGGDFTCCTATPTTVPSSAPTITAVQVLDLIATSS